MDNIWRSAYGAGYRRLLRAVMVRRYSYLHGDREIWHSHEQAQLVFATRGVVRVLTPSGNWLVPPASAMWIMPGVDHELHAIGDATICSAYFEPETVPWLHQQCSLIDMSPLLHELIAAMLNDPPDYAPDSSAALIAPLLLKQLSQAAALQHGMLPLHSDRRLRQICGDLMQQPGDDATLEVWAERVGASARTLARRFREETGMSFGQWRQQMRISEAVTRLAQKQPLADVARALGYASSAAFITMFRKTMGVTPQRYFNGAPRRQAGAN